MKKCNDEIKTQLLAERKTLTTNMVARIKKYTTERKTLTTNVELCTYLGIDVLPEKLKRGMSTMRKCREIIEKLVDRETYAERYYRTESEKNSELEDEDEDEVRRAENILHILRRWLKEDYVDHNNNYEKQIATFENCKNIIEMLHYVEHNMDEFTFSANFNSIIKLMMYERNVICDNDIHIDHMRDRMVEYLENKRYDNRKNNEILKLPFIETREIIVPEEEEEDEFVFDEEEEEN